MPVFFVNLCTFLFLCGTSLASDLGFRKFQTYKQILKVIVMVLSKGLGYAGHNK